MTMSQDLKQILKQANLRLTKPRLAILEVLQQQTKPDHAQGIHQKLEAKNISIDLATVYRNIESLQKIDLVKTINFEDGRLRYELKQNHHHHLVCQVCGRVQPVEECQLDDLTRKLENKYQFKIQRHSLEFFGQCGQCQLNRGAYA